MTMMTSHAPSARQDGGILARAAGLAGGLFSALVEWQRVRHNTRELAGLSDESLKDIGIERSEIERIARFGRTFR